MQLKILMYITETLQAVIFKMRLIHITGVLQTDPHDGIHGMLKIFTVRL